jgi:hypothetical protein
VNTTPYIQVPISSTSVDHTPVSICQTEVNESYSSGTQAAASQPQANVPAWPQYPYQPFFYPGPLNANAKAFVPAPGIGFPTHVGSSPGLGSASSSGTNARRQSGRKTCQGNTPGGRAPSSRCFVGYTDRTTTNIDSPRDNRQVELPKSVPPSADWM